MVALAQRQYGNVTRAQLLELGLPVATIDERIRAEKLTPIHAGVYAIGPPRNDALARAAAAVLACGPDALLSHASAAALWDMGERWTFPAEVTVATHRKRPGIRIHRSATLARADRRRHHGIWVTSPARTLLDIAPRWSDRRLARAVNDSRRAGSLYPGQLNDLLDRCPTIPGAPRLRALIENAPTTPTRSTMEDDFLTFAARHGLPRPQVNTRVCGHEVDALFEPERVIVELDGWEFHNDRTAFINDRERDAEHLQAGYVTVRITWDRLQTQPDREAQRLKAILNAREAP